MRVRIGILAIQGAIEEHTYMLNKVFKKLDIDGEIVHVKKETQLDEIDGLIIPGGESTVIGRVAEASNLLAKIKRLGSQGLPIFGTCAGMVLLAKRIYDRVVGEVSQPTLELMDMLVERNAFGRQRESFEMDLEIPVIGGKFRGIFIRAPVAKEIWGNAKAICQIDKGIVAVEQENLLATAFHPELTDDVRMHKYFLEHFVSLT